MRTFTIMVVIGVVTVIGMLFFPTAHTTIDAVNITALLPLTQSAIRGLPYFFLFMVGYIIYSAVKG